MNYPDMISAVEDAERTINAANQAAYRIAPLLLGRLKHCSCNDLAALKKELRHYNIHTMTWKDDE